MTPKCYSANSMGQNVYLYVCEKTWEGVVIDAGCSSDDIAAIAEDIKGITIKAILLTHGHYDHVSGLARLKSLTKAPVICHALEDEMLKTPALNLSTMFGKNESVLPDSHFQAGDVFTFGGRGLSVLHTPGHTPGCVCFYDSENGHLFSGDTLFHSSIGRTDFPGSSHAQMMSSIKDVLFLLPDTTNVYPGHGSATSIGFEKSYNQFLRD